MQTVIQVIASGYVLQHDNFGAYPDFNWGPGSRAAGLTSAVVDEAFPNGTATTVGFNYNNNQVADTITMMMFPGYSLYKAQRGLTSGLRRWPWYNGYTYYWCDTYTNPPCYTFSGSYLISVSAPAATFTAVSDSSTYGSGSTAEIFMTRSPLTVAGLSTPLQVDSALWQAAADSLGGDAADTVPLNACSNYRWVSTDYACDHAVKGSGTMTIIGHANGYRVTRQVGIAVRDPALTLSADPSATAPGDTVWFTPRWSDGAPVVVSSWKWLPDTLPNLISQDGGDCTAAEVVCKKPIRQTGWMYVTATRNGKQRTAHARVTMLCKAAFPDPTVNDPVLDNGAIRKAFMNLLNKSGPNLDPGDGIADGDSVGNKREHGGYLFRRTDGSIYFVEDTTAFATECTIHLGTGDQYKQNPSDSLIAIVHTHPTKSGDDVYGCPPQAAGGAGSSNQQLLSRGKWDNSRITPQKRSDRSTGGGSLWGDWITVYATTDGYVVNADGEVWKLPKYLLFSEQSGNNLVTKYTGNSNSACNW